MRSKRHFFIALYALAMVISQPQLKAQSAYSTYSILGLGDYVDSAVPAAMGMGGLGVSNGSYWYLNNVNPALLYYNRMALFSAGILAETKNINQDGFEPYQAGSGNLNHLAVAYPLLRDKWSFSLSLQPYTSVNYSFFYNVDLDDLLEEEAIILNDGSGGLTSLNFSAGGLVFKKLSIGVKASYLFSSYEKEYSSITSGDLPAYIASFSLRQSVSDFVFGGGIAYQHKLGNYQLGLGATYDFEKNVNGKVFTRLEQKTLTNQVIFSDTIQNNVDNRLSLPSTLGLGISFGKPEYWLIGFDYKTQDWTGLSNQGDPSARSESFAKGSKFILGGEIIADPFDVRSYLKRITFRAGISYEEKPYILSNTKITEFGINFGWTLPVSRFSSLDFGLMIGNRGTTEQNLVREDFFRVYFGATFNDNRWFIRPKFN